ALTAGWRWSGDRPWRLGNRSRDRNQCKEWQRTIKLRWAPPLILSLCVFRLLLRQWDPIKFIDDDGLGSASQIRPLPFVEARSMFEVLLCDVQQGFFPIVADLQCFPWDGKIFVVYTQEASVIKDSIINIAICGIDYQVFNGTEFFAIRSLDL